MKKYNTNKILGLITICINVLLFFKSLYLLFVYNFTDRLFLFMYPNWVLLINALLGIIGAYIALLLFKNMIGFKLFLIVTLVLWFISLSNYFLSMY
jgi:signal transduction histidine kinase